MYTFSNFLGGFFQTKKLKDNHDWFVDTVSRFKPPNEKSKEALNSQQLKIGSRQLNIQPELKEQALEISPLLVSYRSHFAAIFPKKIVFV